MIAPEHITEEMAEPARARIVSWLSAYLADLLAIDPNDVDVERPFNRYGLDSSAAVGMTGDLSTWLSHEIDPAAVYDYPSIAQLADFLAADAQVQDKLREPS
jgi:acyl carrier protein